MQQPGGRAMDGGMVRDWPETEEMSRGRTARGDGLLGTDGGNRLVAPFRQDRLQALQHHGVIVDHHNQPALAVLVRSSMPGDRQPCRLRHGERQFDAEDGPLARP